MLVKLNSFDDSFLEVGVEERLFKAWVFDGFFVDADDPEEAVDMVHGQGGGEFEDPFVDTLLFFVKNNIFVGVVMASLFKIVPFGDFKL